MVAYSFKKRFVAPIRAGLGLIMKDDKGNWLQCESVIDDGATVSHPFDPYKDLAPEARPKRQTIRAIGKRRHARPGETLQLYTAMRTKQCEKIGEARCIAVLPIRIVVKERSMPTEVDGKHVCVGSANGPTWDGNVCSKQGRADLCRAGLAWHEHGYASLTPEGVRTAVEWPIADLQRRHNDRWLKKRRES